MTTTEMPSIRFERKSARGHRIELARPLPPTLAEMPDLSELATRHAKLAEQVARARDAATVAARELVEAERGDEQRRVDAALAGRTVPSARKSIAARAKVEETEAELATLEAALALSADRLLALAVVRVPEAIERVRDEQASALGRAMDLFVAVDRELERTQELDPPTASHVEAVYRTLPRVHRLPLLFLDWSGARVGSIDSLLIGDYDEPRGRVRLRKATTKTRRALWVELHPDLAGALSESLGPREDRNPDARLFAESGADALRTSIAKACRALGIPQFSPHDLRHRRISLLHLRGVPWARIGEQVGQRNLAVTANTYTHVMLDEGEVDYRELLARAA